LPQGLNNTKTAEKLINQLNADTALLDPQGKEAPQGNITPTANEWETPTPLEATVSAPPFPINSLPDTLRAFALAVAEHTQTPTDMPAVASLGVASACLQGKYLVQGKIGHTEPLNGYYTLIAKPGERKSAVCAAFEEPIKAYEKRKNEAFALDIAHSANIRQVLEKEMEALKNAVAKGKKGYTDMEAKQEELNKHQDIKPLRLICGDATPEALTSLLADNHGRMAMFSAEGGIFATLNGLYSQVPNIDTFLKAHCGDTIRVDRKGRQAEFIEKPCLTTMLFIQPNVLQELVGNDTFRGRGLVARFLYAFPQSTVGNRKYKTQPIPAEVEQKYHQLCADMLDIQQGRDKEPPKLLTLSDEAEALSERFYNELEPRLGKDGDLEHMADWAGKLHGAVLRLAGLLHVVDGISRNGKDFADIPFDSTLTITGQSMAAAVEVGQYFLAHAIACYGISGGSEAERGAVYILERLLKRKPEQFATRDILNWCRRFKTTQDLAEPLIILAERDYIRETKPNYNGTGRPPSTVYVVNPKIYQN